jgi:hypothetical protein
VKLFVVTRGDLTPGQKLAQAIHGARQFAEEHPGIEREWFARSNTVAVLQAPDETALRALILEASERGHRFAVFREPDMGDAVTAVVLEPSAAKIVRHLPLAG